MFLKEGEIRKYRSIRGKLFLVENDKGKLKAYSLSPTTATKEMMHMFKTKQTKTEGEKKKPTELPDSWCGHVFTAEERCRLRTGEEVYAEDFMSRKTGKPFAAEIRWKGAYFDVKFPDRKRFEQK